MSDAGTPTGEDDSPLESSFLDALLVCRDDLELSQRFLQELTSPRERRWFDRRWAAAQLLMQGWTNKDVAQRVDLTEKTVGKIARWTVGDLRVKRQDSEEGAAQEVFERFPKAPGSDGGAA
ncbi:MAG: hypothetical protein QOF01_4353 [Thermomicrobiales bacterium]|nr:hypothetical protein [Thermomicrobiales bacterium]